MKSGKGSETDLHPKLPTLPTFHFYPKLTKASHSQYRALVPRSRFMASCFTPSKARLGKSALSHAWGVHLCGHIPIPAPEEGPEDWRNPWTTTLWLERESVTIMEMVSQNWALGQSCLGQWKGWRIFHHLSEAFVWGRRGVLVSYSLPWLGTFIGQVLCQAF